MKDTVGALEKISLPELDLQQITARVDTGATTSCLHVDNYDIFSKKGKEWVEFSFKKRNKTINHVMPLIKSKKVISSNGKSEVRPVIETTIQLGIMTWTIKLTLTNRHRMRYRMLLGRQALGKKFVVDPAKKFLFADDKDEFFNDLEFFDD